MAKSNKTPKKKDKKVVQVVVDKKPFHEAVALPIKEFLQKCIAAGIVLLLAVKLFYHLYNSFGLEFLQVSNYLLDILRLPTLELVGRALAYSAGVDLPYMLITPGPDEAIEPLILGLASAILFSVSRIGETNIKLAQEIGLYVIILSGLFFVKALFIPNEGDKPHKGLIALLKTNFANWINRIKIALEIT